jgi:hypothetical protein
VTIEVEFPPATAESRPGHSPVEVSSKAFWSLTSEERDETLPPDFLDEVVMFHRSANRDEDVFDTPERFDLSRDPNPHVGFGGGGAHFCLGNQLAKSMLGALFNELLTRIPNFEAGDPELLGTNFMGGVKRMPFRFTPEK